MSKNILFYIVITLLIVISNGCTESNKRSAVNFEVQDISSITKVFLADRAGNTITLDKDTEENWRVNSQFEVRNDAISILLSTISSIRIKKPISKTSFNNVIKYMATSGVSVEIFSGDKMIKAYVIGSNTADHLGTYMILRDTKEPYVVHIPSFNGFLSPRYGIQGNILDVNSWRSNNVFNLEFDDINYIRFTDFLNNKKSYSLSKKPITLRDYNYELVGFKKNNVLKLLNSFENLNCEAYKKDKNKIDFTTPLEELIVNSDTLRTYKMSKIDTKSKEDDFTVERKYATLNSGELMLIQDYVFNKVLINITELKQ
ncbi:MAG: hypothetical protein CMD16_01555 [Flavobacteriales bacterium]|nr:hypothetical protein [Flavobacteriales bacterium]|tara:strand:- start:5068 stop:6012 length:945 start_codon:yes stop_codon:yes gene_type:complete